MNLLDIINHARNRKYMSGIDREKSRVKETGEVFTPTDLVIEILDKFDQSIFNDTSKTFIDNSCGDGQFLSEILIRKMENGSTFEQALSTVYGVDLMIDNVDLCRERLLCGREDLRYIVEQNIVCYDALKYDYKFARRKNVEVKYENIERKKVERAKKKAEREKTELEKIRKDAVSVVSRKIILDTGKEPTQKMIDRELKKLGLL